MVKGMMLAAVVIVACFGLGAFLFWPHGELPPGVATLPPAPTATAEARTVPIREAESKPAATRSDEIVVEVSTEAIKSGALKMGDVNDASLLHLLDELKERHAYDRSQHEGKDGPDSAYLREWMANVTTELASRGYKVVAEEAVTPVPAK